MLTDIVNFISPAEVDWKSAGEIGVYALRVIVTLIILGGFGYGILNIRRFYRFILDTYSEVKLIEWLSRRKTYNYTLFVIVIIFAFTLFILLGDQIFLSARNLVYLEAKINKN